MKLIENNIEKRLYNCPVIYCVKLDNVISLALESVPPSGPNEGYLKDSHYFNNDPFKENLG
jgi:hypothetical protein